MNLAELAIEEGRLGHRRGSSPDRPAYEAQAQVQARTECQFRRICDGLLSLPSITGLRHSNSNRPAAPSIPQTSPERLAQAAADKYDGDYNVENNDHSNAPSTVLYLAYGSNLSAETFLGMRGIKPISQTNVSAPAFDLTFDLPGIAYQEPCFANVAPRKLPKPPKIPPKLPSPPPIPGDPTKPPPLSYVTAAGDGDACDDNNQDEADTTPPSTRDPTWTSGLYGVVYEVTREDYATIIRTEGGGASYRDVLTPCITLPPDFRIPEKPSPIPELPRPFLAHTLYAPRLPDMPGDDDGDYHDHDGSNGDGDDGDDDCKSRLRRWFAKLALPAHRPDPGYAQPSPRYLKLIRDGAEEHGLPVAYRRYLEALRPYQRTTCRQEVGRVLYLALWAPVLLVVLGLSRLLADADDDREDRGDGGDDGGKANGGKRSGAGAGARGGNAPHWLAVLMAVVMNLMWMSYDNVFKPVFGDGERTEESKDNRASRRGGRFGRRRQRRGDEESALLGGNYEEQSLA